MSFRCAKWKRVSPSSRSRTAIFYGVLAVDSSGVPHEHNQALGRIHAVANAPIFGQFDTELRSRHCRRSSHLDLGGEVAERPRRQLGS